VYLLLELENAAATDKLAAIIHRIIFLMCLYTLLLAELVPGRGLTLYFLGRARISMKTLSLVSVGVLLLQIAAASKGELRFANVRPRPV
jgi:hypothetical protein